jgi:hypothetical protein
VVGYTSDSVDKHIQVLSTFLMLSILLTYIEASPGLTEVNMPVLQVLQYFIQGLEDLGLHHAPSTHLRDLN